MNPIPVIMPVPCDTKSLASDPLVKLFRTNRFVRYGIIGSAFIGAGIGAFREGKNEYDDAVNYNKTNPGRYSSADIAIKTAIGTALGGTFGFVVGAVIGIGAPVTIPTCAYFAHKTFSNEKK